MAEEKSTEQARQGKKGTPVLVVLIAALALCIVLFLAFGGSGWFDRSSDLSNAQNATEVAPPADNGADGSSDGTVVSPSETETPSGTQ